MWSKSEVNRAGEQLRSWASNDERGSLPPGMALQKVLEFRDDHLEPLLVVTSQVNAVLQGQDYVQGFVANRLKRTPQIIAKLLRFPTTNLAQMEDIGGCRLVVLGRQDEASELFDRLKESMECLRVRDYVSKPQASGYRALHLVTQDQGRRIEVQVRTLIQQEWASAVERAAGRSGEDLKSGSGPELVHELLVETAELLASVDRNEDLEQSSVEYWKRLRTRNASFIGSLSEAS